MPSLPAQDLPVYTLRKDNTISYKGNYYAVPLGSYRGRGSSVRVLEQDGSVEIYAVETGKLLMKHPLCLEKGKLITNGSCRRNPDIRIEELESRILEKLGDDDTVRNYLSAVRSHFPRNVRDNFAAIVKHIDDTGSASIHRAMELHLSASYHGVNAMLQTASRLQDSRSSSQNKFTYQPFADSGTAISGMIPDKTPMDNYMAIFN